MDSSDNKDLNAALANNSPHMVEVDPSGPRASTARRLFIAIVSSLLGLVFISGFVFAIYAYRPELVDPIRRLLSVGRESTGECTFSQTFTNLDRALLTPDKVCFLSLTDQNYKTLTLELAKLKYIKVLKLDHNDFEQFPRVVLSLRSLKVLSLAQNKLVTLPSEIGSLSNLELLNVNYNQLISLPSSISQLTKLKELKARGNNFGKSELRDIRSFLPVGVERLSL